MLFALNERYLINEKGALKEAASLALTLPELMERVADIWQFIGDGDFETAVAILRELQQELEALV